MSGTAAKSETTTPTDASASTPQTDATSNSPATQPETALVTGATSGIGEALCLLFASDGYNLITVARDKEALEKQADDLRRLDIEVTPIACDLSREGAARVLFEEVHARNLEVDILVNDAGYSPAGNFAELEIPNIRAMLQLSVVNLAELTSVFLHPMLTRGRGRILNMSSMMAKTPCPRNALYGAAKIFVLSFTNALAVELEGTGVTATTVCPGATLTDFPKNAGIDNAPAWKYFAMDADETAIRVYRALMEGKRCAVTGWYNKLGSFAVRFMPLATQMMLSTWLIGTREHPQERESAKHADNNSNSVNTNGTAHSAANQHTANNAAPDNAENKVPHAKKQPKHANTLSDEEDETPSFVAVTNCCTTWNPW